MMNTFKNLLAGNTKVKTEEQANKEVEKLQVQENDLQGKLQETQAGHSKVSAALDIISASLIIDETDKISLANKKKGEAKLEVLTKEIESTQSKLAEVSSKKQEAVKELYRSRGEKARKYNVEQRRNMVIASRFNNVFQLEDALRLAAVYDAKGYDLGVEYGLGATDSLDPRSEDWNFIADMNKEDAAEADKQAEAISRELEEAILSVFKKHNIELNQQTLVNLSRI
ncbi:hypothetical protein P4V88_13895 [Bacillus thuringiensis]|uniref:hypothetical protein n=1 Tax=Bacillus thuringiensis TaxID=1428 RepID=UPI000A380DD4|nr:hypothetical protein [Bacillus thuringiensis]MED2128559.1 hypothetical protein [Bacillus thuringiensis]MED2148337.1 hypothetical protein [Bacillus thuringiensis]MED2173069.1 hypothetical protein [Bacillus thuringiensis]MED2478874.1 hypothetical protein [Bacillus thuringiensis]MED2575920.1 hypothetical protein [Bacillus thuringiensis]